MVQAQQNRSTTTILSGEFLKPEILNFEPFVWKSEPPADIPWEPSKVLTGIEFLGVKSGFRTGDTWFPTWASDDKMYSPWTDGGVWRLSGGIDISGSSHGAYATTGQAVMDGDSPLDLKVYSLGITRGDASPYQGRYPSGSLIHDGVWYYGTYTLGPSSLAQYGDAKYNWPWLGPFVGFRYSTDYGRSWRDSPHTPEDPIFNETGINGYPVKIGAPHFVDFGKNMEHSPDGKAYLVAHGAETGDSPWRFANASWITGNHVYLLRVTPGIENMNDPSKYEFFAGHDHEGTPVWTDQFSDIKPPLSWINNMGCVTVTYNAPLDRYIMIVTDGRNTISEMNTYMLESKSLTGPWKLVTYMKNFGEQAFFVNIPSKFISEDGRTAWLLYSANFFGNLPYNPPAGHSGIKFQKIRLLD